MNHIKFGNQWMDGHHRSGWPYAISSLRGLHSDGGAVLDGFIEKKFSWGKDPGDRYNGFEPYREPWVGFLHNPPNVPAWFNLNRQAPEDIFATAGWKESLPWCRGIFTLSAALRRWLEQRVPVPVHDLLHPTQTPQLRFSMDAYLDNPQKQIIQVGWWLRKFHSFFQLRTRLEKSMLDIGYPWLRPIVKRELELVDDPGDRKSVKIQPYLPHNAYDALLSRNLVFLDLYDSSANNALVECIVRDTPILVNPLDAVVEYLGSGYPLYFESLDEAAAKAEDLRAIRAANEYLQTLPIKAHLTAKSFREAFAASPIYRRLALPEPRV